jgi:hypothetical protein
LFSESVFPADDEKDLELTFAFLPCSGDNEKAEIKILTRLLAIQPTLAPRFPCIAQGNLADR